MLYKVLACSIMETVTSTLCNSIKLPDCTLIVDLNFKTGTEFNDFARLLIIAQDSKSNRSRYRSLLNQSHVLKIKLISALSSNTITFNKFSEVLSMISNFYKLKSPHNMSDEKDLFNLMTLHLSYMISVLIREYLGIYNVEEMISTDFDLSELMMTNSSSLNYIVIYYLKNLESMLPEPDNIEKFQIAKYNSNDFLFSHCIFLAFA